MAASIRVRALSLTAPTVVVRSSSRSGDDATGDERPGSNAESGLGGGEGDHERRCESRRLVLAGERYPPRDRWTRLGEVVGGHEDVEISVIP